MHLKFLPFAARRIASIYGLKAICPFGNGFVGGNSRGTYGNVKRGMPYNIKSALRLWNTQDDRVWLAFLVGFFQNFAHISAECNHAGLVT